MLNELAKTAFLLQAFVLLFAALIVWSITSFIVYEDGPFDVFRLFREIIGVKRDVLAGECTGKNIIAKMLCCFMCTSFWVSIPVVLFVVQEQRPLWFIGWVLAVRTTAILIDSVILHFRS